VAAVHDLEECDLGISREIYVLRTIGDQLHQPTSCHLIIPSPEKKILDREDFFGIHPESPFEIFSTQFILLLVSGLKEIKTTLY